MPLRVEDVRLVGPVTGPGSPSRTDERFALASTDLGICWEDGEGSVLVAFGDSFGDGAQGFGPGHVDWRSNVLTRSWTADPVADGLVLDDAVTDRPGHAAEVLHREGAGEVTVIPTSGLAVDRADGGPVGVERAARGLGAGGPARQFLHYMSVARWGAPGRWRTNHGGVATSDDGGRSWVRGVEARAGNGLLGRHPFQLVALAHDPEQIGRVLVWGTRQGRGGPVHLARVPSLRLDVPAAWEYRAGGTWSRRARDATPVVPAPAGEISVARHRGLDRWLMLHLDEERAAVVLREAEAPHGPWSAGAVVVSGRDVPALYGGYLHPWTLDGPDVAFTLSQWGPYQVTLWAMHLTGAARPAHGPVTEA